MVFLSDTHFATRCIRAGQPSDPSTGAIMTPIYQTSTYVQSAPGVHQGYEYSRVHNPTKTALEQNLCSLEGAKHGICFSSGCAASAAILSTLAPGDHIVANDDLYGGTYRLFKSIYARYGITFSLTDFSSEESINKVISKNTKLMWVETPTNPLLKIVDLRKAAKLARSLNIALCVDNTFATPYLQNPLKLGADLIIHSTTKYIGGHSDVIGGAVITNSEAWAEKVNFNLMTMGACPAPIDSFFVLRGIKTLHIRMDRHVENAQTIADFLDSHKQVETVHYPGLKRFPDYELCKKQMSKPGGMVSFTIKGGEKQARAFLEATRLFQLAESLGGVESLISHPASMTHAAIPAEIREKSGINNALLRLSVGIEDIKDLLADLQKAFELSRG